ncbi:MAG TPA: DinB family protein [Pyrinomonadaceae bacterium]|jgi:uncharacterized damage-inducible protein DinB|nr:DinB family protein [Pyrinomonadaceae bacterium]
MRRSISNALISALLITGSAIVGLAQGGQQPKVVAAPASGVRAELLRQLEEAEKKLVALAEATPQEKYSWRPGEGVRSISEVYMHVAGANFNIPKAAGINPPAGLESDLEKIADKVKVVDTLKRSFEHLRAALVSTADADMDKKVKLFGSDTTARDVFILLTTHAHEHLGQSIAYARMNNIVPPWTAARQQAQPQQQPTPRPKP